MRLVRVHAQADGLVDLPRGERSALGERAARDDRLRDRVGREVALVGHADEVVAQAERVDDLGRRRQQGDDLHTGKSRRRSPSCRSETRSVRARPAAAPSSTRWSNVSDSVHAGRATTAPSTTSARGCDDPHRHGHGVPGVQQRRARLGAVAPGVAHADRGSPKVVRRAGARRAPPRRAGGSRRRSPRCPSPGRPAGPEPSGPVRCRSRCRRARTARRGCRRPSTTR